MKKILIFMPIVAFVSLCMGSATEYNLGAIGQPTKSDTFRTGRPSDIGTNWARRVDQLVELGTNPGTGVVYYFDSGVTTEGNGTSWATAKDTWNEAYDLVTASRGDVLLGAQGHAENLATAGAVAMDAIGVTTLCLGRGQNRPTFTFITDLNTTITITAHSNAILGARFIGDIDGLINPILVQASYTTIADCEFIDHSADNCVAWISGNADADDLLVAYCTNKGTATVGNTAFIALAGCDSAALYRNTSSGAFSAGNFIVATTLCTNLTIEDNKLIQLTNNVPNIVPFTASTGWINRNNCRSPSDTYKNWIAAGSSMSLFENYGVNANAETGLLIGTAST